MLLQRWLDNWQNLIKIIIPQRMLMMVRSSFSFSDRFFYWKVFFSFRNHLIFGTVWCNWGWNRGKIRQCSSSSYSRNSIIFFFFRRQILMIVLFHQVLTMMKLLIVHSLLLHRRYRQRMFKQFRSVLVIQIIQIIILRTIHLQTLRWWRAIVILIKIFRVLIQNHLYQQH